MKKKDFYWKENNWTFFDKSVNKRIVYPVIEKHAEFYFVENQKEINNSEIAYFAAIKGDVCSKEDLMNEYYAKFKFPYFGFNWDALWDCLCDLDWIEQKDIIIYHEVLPQLNAKDLKIYLEILRDTVGNWEKWREHDFEVYFNLKDYDKVQQLIGDSAIV